MWCQQGFELLKLSKLKTSYCYKYSRINSRKTPENQMCAKPESLKKKKKNILFFFFVRVERKLSV